MPLGASRAFTRASASSNRYGSRSASSETRARLGAAVPAVARFMSGHAELLGQVPHVLGTVGELLSDRQQRWKRRCPSRLSPSRTAKFCGCPRALRGTGGRIVIGGPNAQLEHACDGPRRLLRAVRLGSSAFRLRPLCVLMGIKHALSYFGCVPMTSANRSGSRAVWVVTRRGVAARLPEGRPLVLGRAGPKIDGFFDFAAEHLIE